MARQDLDDVSERTSVSLVSCRRQFDNLKRVMKAVPSRPNLFPPLPAPSREPTACSAVYMNVRHPFVIVLACSVAAGQGMHHTAERTLARSQVALGEPDPTDPELFDASRTVYEARSHASLSVPLRRQSQPHARTHADAVWLGTACVRTVGWVDRYLRMGSRRATVPHRR